MESRAKLLGHPIHPMLIVFPLGLFGAAIIFDLIFLFTDNTTMAVVAYWLIAAGSIGGLIAAPFGTADWLAIPERTRAKRVGLMHGVGNVIVLLLFIGSWSLRRDTPLDPAWTAHLLSFLGFGLSLITGWLGGELVDRLGVGVSSNANLNAPSSLHETASERIPGAPR